MQVARTDATSHVRLLRPGDVTRRMCKAIFATILGMASLVGFGLALATPAVAGTPVLTVSPDSGVTPGQNVTVTGSGYAANSLGSVLQCSGDPTVPMVTLPAPVGQTINVSCQALNILKLTSTNGSGGFTTTWKILSGTVGPPCGPPPAAATCPATDSAGIAPATDAANYPCPPTPAQQAAGVTCYIEYGDATLESAKASFTFAGEATAGAPATTAPAPATTAPPTTAAHTTATTAPVAVAPTTVAPATAPVVAPAAAPSTAPLASTGPGPDLWIVGIIGFIALYLGTWLVVLVDRPNNVLYRWVRRSHVATAAGAGPPEGMSVAAPEWADAPEDASVGARPVRPPGLWVG